MKVNGKPVLFDIFCGAGLAAKGYQDAGFYVVGFDIEPQKRYAGDEFYRMDARDFRPEHLADAAAVHTSPCCQFASQITPDKSKHENFIPFIRQLVRDSGKPYVIENVAGARDHLVHPVWLCGAAFGLKVYRHRYFETNFDVFQPEHSPHNDNTPRAGHGVSDKGFISVTSGGKKLTHGGKDARRRSGVYGMSPKGFVSVSGHITGADYCRFAMGVDWYVSAAELVQGIPPVFARFIGLHLMAHLTGNSGIVFDALQLLTANTVPMFTHLLA